MIRSGWIENAFKALGAGAKPRTTVLLLASGMTEGSGAHQGLPRIRPAIRMGVMGIIDVKIIEQTGGKVFR